MKAPAIIWIILVAIRLGFALARSGQEAKINVWNVIFSTSVSVALLWWGGFFRP